MSQPTSLREAVEALLPEWERWYPSLFDAAHDLGLIRARVCPPSALLLARRHAAVYGEAVQAFRERWSAAEEPDQPMPERQAARSTRQPSPVRTRRRSRR